ncbi:YycH family regulatory protein [Evansella sp. AB-rgal1]|uniref:YycH family regulatory protein n=1 Tax=Evansella sp. AB-rgal1 TaxID=3242696 RepID=UPI00359E8CE0
MIENLKTVTLWLLIILSIILTYLIWTYQADYDMLLQPDYFQSEIIGEERTINQLLQPEQIILHEEGSSFWIPPSNNSYKEIIDNVKGIQLDRLYTGAESSKSMIFQVDGLEIIFPKNFKQEWVYSMLNIDSEVSLSMETIDRIILFTNVTSSSEVSIRIISADQEKFYQGNTGMSVNQLQALYRQYGEPFEVEPIYFSREPNPFERRYVLKEEATLRGYSHLSESLSVIAFRQTLLNDPEFVKHYSQGNHESAYTDGNRIMNIVENETILRYINPVSTNHRDTVERSILDASVEFINGHSGWTDQYRLTSWFEGALNDHAVFRMNVDGLSILGSNLNKEEFYTIQVSRTGNQISEYVRPLFEAEAEAFNITNKTLAPYSEIQEYLETSELFDSELIEDAQVGYYMRKQTPSLVIYDPSWFVLERGEWRRVEKPSPSGSLEREVDQSGLE